MSINARTVRLSKSTFSTRVTFGVFSLITFLIFFIGAMTVVYLVSFNGDSTKGYALKKLEAERQRLVLNHEVQQMQISQAKALSSVQNRGIVRSMISANDLQFVRGDSQMAKR